MTYLSNAFLIIAVFVNTAVFFIIDRQPNKTIVLITGGACLFVLIVNIIIWITEPVREAEKKWKDLEG
jgi:hypothetical protein